MDLHFLFPKLMEDWPCTSQHTVTWISLSSIIDLCCYNNFSALLIKVYKYNADHIAITKCINSSSIALDLWVFGLWMKWKTSQHKNWTEFKTRSLKRFRIVLFVYLALFQKRSILCLHVVYSQFAVVTCNFSMLLSCMFWLAPALYFSSKLLLSVSTFK